MQVFYYRFVIQGDHNQNKLKEVFLEENLPKIRHWNRTIVFEQRPKMHQMFRILYKVIRGIYVSVIYYFVPFLFLYLEQYIVRRTVVQRR